MIELLADVLMIAGTIFLLAAAIGVLRFPDIYSRLHAAGKGDTLGQALVLLGLMLLAGATLISVKLAFIVLFVLVFNPTATHALARGAWVSGIRPWTGQRERPFVQKEGQLTDAEREDLYAAGQESAEASPSPEEDGRG